eukprot:COSAG03_NODE_2143_length_3079_cov_7.533557_1_plen_273_part_00
MDLSGVGGSTSGSPSGVSNGDGISRSNSAASPSLASVASADSAASASGSTGGENDSQASVSAHSKPVGLELLLESHDDSSASSAGIASAGGANRHPGASRSAQAEQQQWERTLQSQAVAISFMQSQIGALAEMMRDVNSKMDSLLQLQRSSVAQPTAQAPPEQPRAVAATASSAPAHMPAAAEAEIDPSIDGDSSPERGEPIPQDAPLHSGTNDTAKPSSGKTSRPRRGSITAETVIAEAEEGEEDDEEDDDGHAAAPDGGLRTAKQDEIDL